jgi:hypothetical protein
MKIKLPLTPDQVMALEKLMNQVDLLYKPTTMEGKAIRSINFFVSDKINKTYRNLNRSPDLFNHKKKAIVTLEHYEAFALFKVINALISNIAISQEQRLDFQTISDFLHQKLV